MAFCPSNRRAAQRFRYSDGSRAGFIELQNDSVGPDELKQLLQMVEDVLWVKPHRKGSKAQQGNFSDGHLQQHNWEVMTTALAHSGKHPFEFEVTLNQHMKPNALAGMPRTVTVCFKEPPIGMVAEAWRLLSGAVGHLALFPSSTAQWREEAVANERVGRPASLPEPQAPPPPPQPILTTIAAFDGDCWGGEYLKFEPNNHIIHRSAPSGVDPQGWSYGLHLESNLMGWFPETYVHC